MQTLEYLVIISGVFFSFTFFWLLTVVGALDCLRTSPIKSAFHCLGLITTQSEQVLADSRARLRQRQRNQNHSTPLHFRLKPISALHSLTSPTEYKLTTLFNFVCIFSLIHFYMSRIQWNCGLSWYSY